MVMLDEDSKHCTYRSTSVRGEYQREALYICHSYPAGNTAL